MTGERQRLRVIHTLKPNGPSWSLSEIEVHEESWDADYNGGKELRGDQSLRALKWFMPGETEVWLQCVREKY